MKLRPLELRMKLYDEVYSLRRLGLSYSQIIKIIQEKYNERLTFSHISYWIRGIYNPYGRVITLDDIKPSKELAFIIGSIIGDGNIFIYAKEKKHYYRICLICKDFDYALEFARCLEYIGVNSRIGKRRNGCYIVEEYSRTLCELLKKPLDIEKLRQYIEYSVETITSFLRAFCDSEGYVDRRGNIYVYNTDIKILNYIKELLLRLKIDVTGPHLLAKKGIPFYDRKRGKTYYAKKDEYYLYIRVNSRGRFAELIGFTIRRKMERLMKALNPPPFFSLA